MIDYKIRSIKLIFILSLVLVIFAFWWHYLRYPQGCFPFKRYTLHLTFDDGPIDDGSTESVLNALDDEQAPATFFVSGEQLVDEASYLLAKRRLMPDSFVAGVGFKTISSIPERTGDFLSKRYDLLSRMLASGHLIASHSFLHIPHNLWSPITYELDGKKPLWNRGYFRSEEAMKQNVSLGRKVLGTYLPSTHRFIRLPFGAGTFGRNGTFKFNQVNLIVARTLRLAGFQHVGWHIDSKDWYYSRLSVHPETGIPLTRADQDHLLIHRLLKKTCETNGGIVLFHDIDRLTAGFIQSWIQKIRRAGHRLVSLKEIAPRCFLPTTRQKQLDNIEFHQDGKLKQCWHGRTL